jgi:glutaredoxin
MRLRDVLAAALASILALAAAAASAQLYRWTDEKGRVHITDTPPPPSAKNVQKKSASGAPAGAPAPAQTPYELAQAMKNFPVTLYTSPNCTQPCANARTVLNQRGVPFKEVQVWDEQTNAELSQLSSGRNEVPTLVVGRSVHVGFQQSAYESLLDSARYPKAGAVPARSQAAPAPPEGYAPPPAAEPVTPEPEEPAPTGPYAPRPPPGRQ